MKPTPSLVEVFRRHGTDKHSHGYHAFYETLPAPARLLEVGVFKGASLRAWCEWWPEADILGADTFTREPCPPSLTPLSRPSVVQCDSRTDNFAKYYEPGDGPDLVIDDGSHRPLDQAATFRNLWPLVAPGGVYVIEDVLPWADEERGEELHPWFAERKEHFNAQTWSALIATIREMSGQMETHHDFRAQSGKPDSYLLVVRKPTAP